MTLPHSPGAAAPGILVVDDDALVRDLLGATLPRCGFRVWLADGGAEAVRLYPDLRGQVALALLDVRMPGLDGPATLRELRRLDPCLRCCFLTGEPGLYGEEGLLALGAERVFLKPFRLPELTAGLQALLGPA
jgi:CheY-like chemotaxis protein